MSVSSIPSSSSLSQSWQNWQAKAQTIKTEFQQLGQDLQAGNLSQAQSVFSALSQNLPASLQSSSSVSLQSNSSLSQAFSALGSALQSGSLSAAQQAYTTMQQDVQQAGQVLHHHHHHQTVSGSQSTTSSTGSTVSQLFSSLGSDLQTGNLSAAQTAYSTLQQDLAQFGGTAGTASQWAGTLNIIG